MARYSISVGLPSKILALYSRIYRKHPLGTSAELLDPCTYVSKLCFLCDVSQVSGTFSLYARGIQAPTWPLH